MFDVLYRRLGPVENDDERKKQTTQGIKPPYLCVEANWCDVVSTESRQGKGITVWHDKLMGKAIEPALKMTSIRYRLRSVTCVVETGNAKPETAYQSWRQQLCE